MRENLDIGVNKVWHDWQQDGCGGHKCRDCGIKFSDYVKKYKVCRGNAPTEQTQRTETVVPPVVSQLHTSPIRSYEHEKYAMAQSVARWGKDRQHAPDTTKQTGSNNRTMTEQHQVETFTPILDRLLVVLDKPEQRTQGGIIIPDTAQNAPQRGIVVAAGPGGLSEDGLVMPMYVKGGDKVLFAKYSGTEVKINGVDYLIISQRDVLGHVSVTNVDLSHELAAVE